MTIDETQVSDEKIRGHQLIANSNVLTNHFAKEYPLVAVTRLRNIVEAWINQTIFFPGSTDLWLEVDAFHVVMGLSKNEEFLDLCLFATEENSFLTIDNKKHIRGQRVKEIMSLGSHHMADKSPCQISNDLYELLQKAASSLLVPANHP